MMNVTIRPYEHRDLGRVLQIWEHLNGHAGSLSIDEAVDLLQSEPAVSLVAEVDGELKGMALGSTSGAVGWVHRLSVEPPHQDEVSERLMEDLEAHLAESGARRLQAIVAGDEPARGQLERRDFRPVEGTLYLERMIASVNAVPSGLVEVFGRMIQPGLWDEMKGLDEAKQIIERRVILPLAEPELARRHAVAPPRAIVLFGPPGLERRRSPRESRRIWPGPSSRSSLPSWLGRAPSIRHACSRRRSIGSSSSMRR